MKDGLTAVLAEHRELLLGRTKLDWDRNVVNARADRLMNTIPGWVDALLSASVVVGCPKVLRARSMYEGVMIVEDCGLFVAVQAVLRTSAGASRIYDARDALGDPDVQIPRLNMKFGLTEDERQAVALRRPDIMSAIVSASDALAGPLCAAIFTAAHAAPAMVRAVRAATAEGEHGLVAKKLAPYLKGNPLRALPPAALSLIFRIPWAELDRLVSFLKQNRALAGGVDEESVPYILDLIVAQDVMDS